MRVLRAKDFKVDSAIDLLTRQMVGFVWSYIPFAQSHTCPLFRNCVTNGNWTKFSRIHLAIFWRFTECLCRTHFTNSTSSADPSTFSLSAPCTWTFSQRLWPEMRLLHRLYNPACIEILKMVCLLSVAG
jgi:hypothetical protein